MSQVSSDPDLPGMYESYERRLREVGNVDFGDLILLCAEAMEPGSPAGTYVRDRFRVVLVDEYQDSNISQFNLLRQMKGDGTYLCVVGDDDQSIYRFRGAEVRKHTYLQ